ncbi:hypothetical protein IJJ36_04140 [Candidatus Saccharibacteria bacterium]|nr:hypothetical protein [Candidatus Saccharibacteria bacterium]
MNNARGLKSNRFWVLIWGCFFAVIAIVLIVSLLSQRRLIMGGDIEDTHIKSLTCESDSYLYPFFVFDQSIKKEFKIILTFDERSFKTISLQQMLYYDDDEYIKQSETKNHAAMNISFGENGLKADALDAVYARRKDGMRFGIYGVREGISDNAMRYFLLDEAEGYDYDNVKLIYEGLGMICTSMNI